jgi:hypothetical protein
VLYVFGVLLTAAEVTWATDVPLTQTLGLIPIQGFLLRGISAVAEPRLLSALAAVLFLSWSVAHLIDANPASPSRARRGQLTRVLRTFAPFLVLVAPYSCWPCPRPPVLSFSQGERYRSRSTARSRVPLDKR